MLNGSEVGQTMTEGTQLAEAGKVWDLWLPAAMYLRA